MRSFHGNFGMMVRAYAYIRELGPKGLRDVTDMAVLNANYVAAKLKAHYPLAFDHPPMHESRLHRSRDRGENGREKTLDIAKRLIDYGFHPPTVYFPLVVRGAMMIEPTETETMQTLDAFVDAMDAIRQEAEVTHDLVIQAPHNTRVGRPGRSPSRKKTGNFATAKRRRRSERGTSRPLRGLGDAAAGPVRLLVPGSASIFFATALLDSGHWAPSEIFLGVTRRTLRSRPAHSHWVRRFTNQISALPLAPVAICPWRPWRKK